MDSALLISVIGLAINVVVGLAVLAGFLWRIPSKDDLKRVEDKVDDNAKQLQSLAGDVRSLEARLDGVDKRIDGVDKRLDGIDKRLDGIDDAIRAVNEKADASLALHREVSIELKVMQASILRLESYFETPKLKSS